MTKEELRKQIGIAMGLVYRGATNQWLMDVQPADGEWHMHDMTSEVENVAALLDTYCEQRETALIAKAAASQYTSLDHPLGKRYPSKQEVDAYNAGHRDAQEAIRQFFKETT